MKVSGTKIIIQLLILLIIAVIIFILSVSLYSIRYWPDVYNYINANITIKRIPTITELNVSYYDETTDYATTDYVLDTTMEDGKDYFSLEDVENRRDIREVMKDYEELPKIGVINYFFEFEPTTDAWNVTNTVDSVLLKERLKLMRGIYGKCDTYYTCLNSFINSFFKVNYFEPSEVKSDGINFSGENINKIISGVSGFLKDEIKGVTGLDSDYHSFNKSNGTTIFVKTFIADGNFNFDDEELINNTDYNINDHLTTETNYIIKETGLEKLPKRINSFFETDNNIDIDYDNEDNSTDYPIIDYIELYKDTTNEYVTSTELIISHEKIFIDNANETNTYYNESCPLGTSDDVTGVFSWIAAIFVKNGTDQFQYHCDGALLSTNIIVTAARCVNFTRAEDIVVILGKTSLQNMKENEKIFKISEIVIHENFTESTDDIAVLKTEDEVDASHSISFACFSDGGDITNAVTTGWAVSGELTAIHFDKDKSQQCSAEDVCGVYGNNVTVCPSFGGVYAVKQGGWYLRGIRTEIEPNDRSLCINKPLHYTPLHLYSDWIYNI